MNAVLGLNLIITISNKKQSYGTHNKNETSLRYRLQALGIKSADLLELDIASKFIGGDRDYGMGIVRS